jgi:hypothetical protein
MDSVWGLYVLRAVDRHEKPEGENFGKTFLFW